MDEVRAVFSELPYRLEKLRHVNAFSFTSGCLRWSFPANRRARSPVDEWNVMTRLQQVYPGRERSVFTPPFRLHRDHINQPIYFRFALLSFPICN